MGKPSLDNTLIFEPSIYVIGRQEVDVAEMARLLGDLWAPNYTTDAPSSGEALIEACGRLCYKSFTRPRPGGNRAYLNHIRNVGHGSVLEHAVLTIVIGGVSRTLTHELVRHRVGLSPSQLSQRFVDESAERFVVPPLIAKLEGSKAPLFLAWRRSVLEARANYIDAAECLDQDFAVLSPDPTMRRKRVREAARSLLPGCTATMIALTGNARAWRHVLDLRGSIAADLEIRRLSAALLPVLQREWPNLMDDFEAVTAEDGFPAVKMKRGRNHER